MFVDVGMFATQLQGHARSWRRFVKIRDLPARQRRLPIAFHAKPWKIWKNMGLLALRVASGGKDMLTEHVSLSKIRKECRSETGKLPDIGKSAKSHHFSF